MFSLRLARTRALKLSFLCVTGFLGLWALISTTCSPDAHVAKSSLGGRRVERHVVSEDSHKGGEER